MSELRDRVRGLSEDYAEVNRRDRRHLHAHPELSFQEVQTVSYVADRLDEIGIPHRRVAGTGLVAEVRGGSGPTLALRADLDALPIQEKKRSGLPQHC